MPTDTCERDEYVERQIVAYEGVSKSFRTESIMKHTLTFDITR